MAYTVHKNNIKGCLNLIQQVLMAGYNATEGWAPSTYMEKLPARYRTLDRP